MAANDIKSRGLKQLRKSCDNLKDNDDGDDDDEDEDEDTANRADIIVKYIAKVVLCKYVALDHAMGIIQRGLFDGGAETVSLHSFARDNIVGSVPV